jgi:DNA-binding CsgD family transcriptional regulator
MDEEKKKVGRPKIEIDEDLLLKLASIHCTMKEMVDILGVSEDTLKNNFSGIIDKGKATGKMRLRRKQLEVALEDGNPTMLIFLGKAILSQSDNPLNSDDKKILPWSDDV